MAKALTKSWGRKSNFRLNMEAMVSAFIVAMVIRTYLVTPFKIPTSSMFPTLVGDPKTGDRILVNRFTYFFKEPERGDIVVFKTRGIEGLEQNLDYIKRLVGLPGETLYIKDDRLYINHEPLTDHPFFSDKRYSFNDHIMDWGSPEEPVVIPQDVYFVLGDNTDNSRDSRFFGFVPKNNVKGRAILIWWPFARIGKLN